MGSWGVALYVCHEDLSSQPEDVLACISRTQTGLPCCQSCILKTSFALLNNTIKNKTYAEYSQGWKWSPCISRRSGQQTAHQGSLALSENSNPFLLSSCFSSSLLFLFLSPLLLLLQLIFHDPFPLQGNVVGWGTVQHEGKSRVHFPKR
jgi:hypothetical protein